MDEVLDWADVAVVKVIAGAVDDPEWHEQNSKPNLSGNKS